MAGPPARIYFVPFLWLLVHFFSGFYFGFLLWVILMEAGVSTSEDVFLEDPWPMACVFGFSVLIITQAAFPKSLFRWRLSWCKNHRLTQGTKRTHNDHNDYSRRPKSATLSTTFSPDEKGVIALANLDSPATPDSTSPSRFRSSSLPSFRKRPPVRNFQKIFGIINCF